MINQYIYIYLNIAKGYQDNFTTRKREDAVQHIEGLYSKIRWDLLKTAVFKVFFFPFFLKIYIYL